MPEQGLIRAPEPPPLPTTRELAMVLFRRRRVFACVSGMLLAAAVVYAITGTKYEAKMKVLVRHGRANAPVTAQENAPLDLTRIAVTEEELNTEVELLRDDEVLRRVVQQTGVGGRDWFRFLHGRDGNQERIERMARRLARKLQVEPIKKTNLIAVSYAADDPQRATAVLEAVEKTYLEKHMDVHRPSGEHRFFELQTAEARIQLEQSKKTLLDFTAERGVVVASEQRDLALQKFSELDAAYRQTLIERIETQQRVWELESQLQKLPERTTTQVRLADNPELLKALKSNLLDLQLKRTGLLTKFEPTHRLVQEVNQEIAQAQSAIAEENAKPLRDETTDKNPQYEWAKTELEKAQVQLKALQAREMATRTQEGAYRAATRKLGKDAIAQDDLVNSEKEAEESYLLYLKKQEEARMDDALDEKGIVNVAIAEHPVAPSLPIWSAWTVLALGFVVAGAGGASAAFAVDYLDPAFRTPEDVIAFLNAPVLASLPRMSGKRFSA